MKTLEVIATNQQDVIDASNLEFVRLELCDNIEYDGLSFTLSDLKKICSNLNTPARIMLRVTPDFLIHDNLNLLLNYISIVKKWNHPFIEGFVLGFLTEEQRLDYEINDILTKACLPLKVTIHKCSDILISNNDFEQLNMLIADNPNIDAILTQGGLSQIEDNLEVLQNLSMYYRIIIGGGINKKNFKKFKNINADLHIGRFARKEQNYKNGLDTKLIKKLSKKINK